MGLMVLFSILLVIGIVCVVVSIWERDLVAAAVLWILLGLPVRWHVEGLMPYQKAFVGHVVVVLLLFVVPGVAMVRRWSWGWWVAVITSAILGIIAPGYFFSSPEGSVGIPLAVIHFVLYFPCFVALLVNNPWGWRERTSTASPDEAQTG